MKQRPVIVTDPGEISFLRKVQKLPPHAQAALTQLARAVVDRKPAHVVRQLALDLMKAKGMSSAAAVQEVDWFMQSVIIQKGDLPYS